MRDLKCFDYWCQKVLPLVYDDSLSYYEALCKIVDFINNMLNDADHMSDEIKELQADMCEVQKWIDNYDTSFAEKIIEEHLGRMIIVSITDDGYIKYSLPETWDDIQFNTTGLDIFIDNQEYGRLTLSY